MTVQLQTNDGHMILDGATVLVSGHMLPLSHLHVTPHDRLPIYPTYPRKKNVFFPQI